MRRRDIRRRVSRLERLERRRLLAAESAPALIQIFDASYETIEDRTADIFEVGYGGIWLPPPGRADIGNFSVGYDPYDRFDLGSPDRPTLYGTETGLKQTIEVLDAAGVDVYIDGILNHAGFSDTGTPGFVEAGGYPGLAITLPNAIDGDFHGRFETGDLNFRLSGLVDFDHTTNHQFVRHPVDPDDPRNIAPGTEPAFGRLANIPDPANERFYPDRDADPISLFNPLTGESDILVYPFTGVAEGAGDGVGDAVTENVTGYLMRYLQWMVQEVGVDGFRLDAVKHFEPWVMAYVDQALYRSHPEPLLDGSTKHVFAFSEVLDGNRDYLQSFVRKDINDADPGRIGGNRDVLDFSTFFALRGNLGSAGTPNAWFNIRDAMLDLTDDGLHNGSQGVLFVNSHDDFGPGELGNVAQAFTLLYPGNTVVYLNAKEFGEGREFPKPGRGDALGGVYGDVVETLVGIRNTHGRGDFLERWIDDQGLYVFERESSMVVGLSNRGDNGFDGRTVQTSFAAGTHLVELTGNASDPAIDPYDDIPEVVTVKADGTIDIRVPRNRNADGTFHGTGYVVYGLPTPRIDAGLEILGGSGVLQGTTPEPDDVENGITRLSDLTVITGDQFDLRLQTAEVRLLGNDSLRDVDADGDNALFSIDAGIDANGNGGVDFVTPGSVAYGYERFDTASPLIGSAGTSGPRGNGLYQQTIDATELSEGRHFIASRAFRHRTDGGPAVFTEHRESIYVDRLPPESEIVSFEPWEPGVNENRDLIIRSADRTAEEVHVFLNLPAGLDDATVLSYVDESNAARATDRDEFIYGFGGLRHGNNAVTVVTREVTGNTNIQRFGGLFTSTIFGAGLGDIDFDGDRDADDVTAMRWVVASNNQQFNPAADIDGDGDVDDADLQSFLNDYVDASRVPVDFGDSPFETVRPNFVFEPTVAPEVILGVGDDAVALPVGGAVRGDDAGDTRYYRMTLRVDDFGGGGVSPSERFAVSFGSGGTPTLEVGAIGGRWSLTGGGNTVPLNFTGRTADVADGDRIDVLLKVRYTAAGPDKVTLWTDPLDRLDNGQLGSSTTFTVVDASFDAVTVAVDGGSSSSVRWSLDGWRVGRQIKPGPAHLIGGPRLGTEVDPDGGHQPSASADADDRTFVADEDGVTFLDEPTAGGAWPVEVFAPLGGRLDAWLDLNGDGDLTEDERLTPPTGIDVNGIQRLDLQLPGGAPVDTAVARFRLSSAGGLDPYRFAVDGEVEDYVTAIRAGDPRILDVRVGHGLPGRRPGVSLDAPSTTRISDAGIDTISIRFDRDVNVPRGSIRLYDQTGRVADADFAAVDSTADWRATLPAGLPDGRYRLIVDDSVTDASGAALDGDPPAIAGQPSGDGSGGGRYEVTFDLLAGDIDRSGRVDRADLDRVAFRFGIAADNVHFDVAIDVDGDGRIGIADVEVVRDALFNELGQSPAYAPLAIDGAALGLIDDGDAVGRYATLLFEARAELLAARDDPQPDRTHEANRRYQRLRRERPTWQAIHESADAGGRPVAEQIRELALLSTERIDAELARVR